MPGPGRRRVAIIGSGVSGLVSAWLLHRCHDITLFEADDRIGGHTHTVDVEWEGERHAVDTGFIVYNEPNYPNFTALLGELGVATQESDMSFSVHCERTGLEYNGHTLNTLFAQRSNLLRPSFLRMVREILRFNREAVGLLDQRDDSMSLGAYLEAGRFAPSFVDHYIVPMASALWSAPPGQILEFPARHFAAFFKNHGFLEVGRRPQWRVIRGGSQRYVEALTAPFLDRIRLSSPVRSVLRLPRGVEVTVAGRPAEWFDEVVIAVHSDQALRMLADASVEERSVLGAIRYQKNDVVLHTDASLLPHRRLARASWNYRIPAEPGGAAQVTYWMNRLQTLRTSIPFCVSLNAGSRVDPARVVARFVYDHPVYSRDTFAAQDRRRLINGRNRTWFCGAYWGYGFHEDGVRSAMEMYESFCLGGNVGERVA